MKLISRNTQETLLAFTDFFPNFFDSQNQSLTLNILCPNFLKAETSTLEGDFSRVRAFSDEVLCEGGVIRLRS